MSVSAGSQSSNDLLGASFEPSLECQQVKAITSVQSLENVGLRTWAVNKQLQQTATTNSYNEQLQQTGTTNSYNEQLQQTVEISCKVDSFSGSGVPLGFLPPWGFQD